MALEFLSQFACFRVIYMDQRVVAARNDFVVVKLQTSNNMSGMSGKGDVAGLDLSACPILTYHVVASIDGLEEMKLAKTR
jgi:hypothetical protein